MRHRERLADENPHDDIRVIERPMLSLVGSDGLFLRLIVQGGDKTSRWNAGGLLSVAA